MDHLRFRDAHRPYTHCTAHARLSVRLPGGLTADGAAAASLVLGGTVLVFYALYCEAGTWDTLLAAASRVVRDHDMPVRDLGRALSLARSLRGQAAVEPAPWPLAAQALWHDVKARADALPGIGTGYAQRLVLLLACLH
ncbi:hypothetical protein AB4156_03010 [Cupriavidus sp. 2MCAB6]|uniref:hypothetical protein n=1 Tax=Cupriavidus sp. 2MCAB6 TaxID=3232981 RepID=UPI003F907D02